MGGQRCGTVDQISHGAPHSVGIAFAPPKPLCSNILPGHTASDISGPWNLALRRNNSAHRIIESWPQKPSKVKPAQGAAPIGPIYDPSFYLLIVPV